MTRPAELAGRWLEPASDVRPRGMAVHDRTRLTGQLHLSSVRKLPSDRMSLSGDAANSCNCLIFKHNYLMRYFQYA